MPFLIVLYKNDTLKCLGIGNKIGDETKNNLIIYMIITQRLII